MSHPASKIGIFGGSFDPVHLGHVAVAQSAVKALELEQLILIPAAHSPFKERPHANDAQRLDMLQLAFKEHLYTSIDQRELKRPAPSYTIDTVLELAQEHTGAALYLILGQDAWNGFKRWYRWQDILGLVQVVVVYRQSPDQGPEQKIVSLPEGVIEIKMPAEAASSSRIRQAIPLGQDLSTLLPLSVQNYIEKHQLYA